MRIAALDEPFDEEIGPLLHSMMPAGRPPIALFRTLGRNPAMTAAMREWGAYCLSRRLSLDMRTREVIIDRVTARCGCEYEFGVHVAFFTEPQLLDMLMLAGWYHAISFVARAAQVPLEDGAPTFASLQ